MSAQSNMAAIAALQSGEDVARQVAGRVNHFRTDAEVLAFITGFTKHAITLRAAAHLDNRPGERPEAAFLEARDELVREGLLAMGRKLTSLAHDPADLAA